MTEEKKRTRNVGNLHLYEVEERMHGESRNFSRLIPVDVEYPEYTQVHQMERWVSQQARDPSSALEDGEYVILRVMKGIRVGTVRSADVCDASELLKGFTGKSTDEEPEESEPEEVEPEIPNVPLEEQDYTGQRSIFDAPATPDTRESLAKQALADAQPKKRAMGPAPDKKLTVTKRRKSKPIETVQPPSE